MQHHDSCEKETIVTDDASFDSSENLQYSDWHAESESVLVVKFLAVVGVRIHLQNSFNYNCNNSVPHLQMVNTG